MIRSLFQLARRKLVDLFTSKVHFVYMLYLNDSPSTEKYMLFSMFSVGGRRAPYKFSSASSFWAASAEQFLSSILQIWMFIFVSERVDVKLFFVAN